MPCRDEMSERRQVGVSVTERKDYRTLRETAPLKARIPSSAHKKGYTNGMSFFVCVIAGSPLKTARTRERKSKASTESGG